MPLFYPEFSNRLYQINQPIALVGFNHNSKQFEKRMSFT